MKKILFIVVSLLATTLTYSQSFSKVIQSTKSEWINEEWKVVATDYPKDMFIILKDAEVIIGEYKFRTYGESEKTNYEKHVCYTWKCVNGNGDKCTFMMKKFKPEVSSHMLYSILYNTGVMYEYETED